MLPLPIDVDLSSLSNLAVPMGVTSSLSSLVDPTQATSIIKGIRSKVKRRGKNGGEQLKFDLGLQNYPYVMIQKVIAAPIPMFLVSYDSRRPSVYISPSKLRK